MTPAEWVGAHPWAVGVAIFVLLLIAYFDVYRRPPQ